MSDTLPTPTPEGAWLDQLLGQFVDTLKDSGDVDLGRVIAEHPELEAKVREVFALAQTLVPQSGSRAPVVPGYRILHLLGEGGMGSVYLAEQTQPLPRRVALKVIKLGMDTRSVLARFATERATLARMEHSHIAKVFDAGSTAQGQPWFAMEYVKGEPITRYCDANKLSIEDRLALFLQVCSGVQHAHLKGVIHRDLTPNNVLVSVQDGRAAAKIIDFGLARATDHQITEKTVATAPGMVLGTLPYMAPEQASVSGLDIDTRADVYTLGVLLYELLVGEPPFGRDELKGIGWDVVCRTLREKEAPRPSTKIARATPHSTQVAVQRRTDIATLRSRLRGDLDWIAMQCLEKDRVRRYTTVAELAADLERHLRHEPVLARPPALNYQLAKFIRRNRVVVVAGGMLAAVIVGAAVATTWLAVERGRAIDRYRVLRVGAMIDTVNRRWDDIDAQPPWPNQAPDLRALTMRISEVQSSDNLMRATVAVLRLHSITGSRGRSSDRPPAAQTQRLERLRGERKRLADIVAGSGFDDAHRRLGQDELAEVDHHIRDLEAAIADSDRNELANADDQFIHDRIEQQIFDLELVVDEVLPELQWRLATAETVAGISIDQHAARWRDALASIRSDARMQGVESFTEQMGLVPLGQDPASGLFEFAEVCSGEVPQRGQDGKLDVGVNHGIVFVLLPPGTLVRPNDREATETHIDSFFLAKHELSRAQWQRLGRGIRGLRLHLDGMLDWRNLSPPELDKPATFVTCDMCMRLAKRFGLDLPTEAEWEYACRAGTSTPWWKGADPACLRGVANVLDADYAEAARQRGEPVTEHAPFSDGYPRLASVLAPLEPNPFGLMHVHGNVKEWCRDCVRDAGLRATRGGAWNELPPSSRVDSRNRTVPTASARDTGVRLARRIHRSR